jgi:hypothetical protein
MNQLVELQLDYDYMIEPFVGDKQQPITSATETENDRATSTRSSIIRRGGAILANFIR